jgi:hypothetical protein
VLDLGLTFPEIASNATDWRRAAQGVFRATTILRNINRLYEVVVPKYVKAGVKKIVWIWPGESGSDGTTETPNGNYENRYFDAVEQRSRGSQAKVEVSRCPVSAGWPTIKPLSTSGPLSG